MKPIPYGRQTITQEDIDQVVDVLKSDFLTQGPRVASFEKAFAEYIGSEYAVAVSNGTAALHIACLSLGLQKGDKVITTPITFAASANCVRYCGAEVVFSDIDPDTFLLDINKVKTLLEASPKGTYKGIIPVDFAGYPLQMNEWRALADEYDLWLIQDACHAPGGEFSLDGNTHRCGDTTFSELGIFSFHPVKHIAAGEGGMVTTNDKDLYDQLLLLRSHGITKDPDLLNENHGGWYYEMQSLGYNCRITDMQAALAESQLSKNDIGLTRRRQIADNYTQAFKDAAIQIPFVSEHVNHAYHLYVIQVEDRKGLYDFLRTKNIFSQVLYIPIHTMPYYADLGYEVGDFPIAEAYYSRCLALPMFPGLTDEEQAYVIESVLLFIQ